MGWGEGGEEEKISKKIVTSAIVPSVLGVVAGGLCNVESMAWDNGKMATCKRECKNKINIYSME